VRCRLAKLQEDHRQLVDAYFDIESLAKYLHLTPDQVRKMAEREQLPGQRVGGDWRFPKREIFHWFEERIGVADEPEVKKYETLLQSRDSGVDPDSLTIARLMPNELIWLDCPCRSKNSLIRDLCQWVADKGYIWDAEKMATAIQSREQLHSTALENGVALLHSRRPQADNLNEPFLALARTPSGIPFGGPRGILTDMFFLIASDSDAFHLQLLARITRILSQANVISELRDAADEQQVLQVMLAAEGLVI
jgi:nitrogen PTS system EIIA component